MKRILLSLVMVLLVSMGAWAQSAPSVSFDGTKCTITWDGSSPEYFDLSDENQAKNLFGEATWNQIKAAETLVFEGKIGSLDAFNNGVSVAKTVDFKNAQFKMATEWNGNPSVINDESGQQLQPVTSMKFTYWQNTLENAITPDADHMNNSWYISKDAFQNCKKIKTVEFNSGKVTGVALNAGDVPNLVSVSFNEGVTEITSKAFKDIFKSADQNGNATHVNMPILSLPSSITKVGEQAFFGCNAFDDVTMKQLDGTCEFGVNVFESCTQLKHVTLSEGVTAIPAHMFDKCGMLESVRIPSTAKYIGEKAFNICASLHSIIIPEGVERLDKFVFENSGLTDIYVMATSAATVPAIYSMGDSWGNNGTFLNTNGISGSDDPTKHGHRNDITNADEETILTWYQDELSDGRFGLGGGNCMVRLHYPEEMRWFYDGWENPITGATDWATSNDALTGQLLTDKVNAGTTGGYISSAYAVGTSDGDYMAFGHDKDGNYWPIRTDYLLRLESGYPGRYNQQEPNAMAWRQLPIQTGAKPTDYIFSKEYDDTWYTMCFPWDMEDNQLFAAFNQDCEITEFVGAEVVEADESTEDNKLYNLIFHFDQVAKTYYMTDDHLEDGLEYVRDPNGTRVDEIDFSGQKIKIKYYTYNLVKGNDPGYETVYYPQGLPKNKSEFTAAQKAMVERYEKIKHFMVFAGHPYMIHPHIGAKPKRPAECTFAGVRKFVGAELLTSLAADSAVTKDATIDGIAYHKPGKQPFPDGGKYTFIGNIDDYAADATVKRKDMPLPAYFLAVDPEATDGIRDTYPRYYRKSSGGAQKWSQYSAIIRPDETAMNTIEAFLELNSYGGSDSGVNGFDVKFGEWEVVTPDGIEEIISDAEKNNQSVKRINVNAVFDVKGQVVREGISVEGLPQGLYIVNGKKYMVK